MGSIEKRVRAGSSRWYARYRDPANAQRVRVFDRKTDAERFLTTVENAKLVGAYIDPTLSRLTVGVWAERWLQGQTHLKPSTLERYAGIVREHIGPRWQTTPLSEVTHGAVQAWVSTLATQRSAATVRKVHRVLSLMLKSAVMDGRLVRNPADGVNLPRVIEGELRFLDHDQVRWLADECGEMGIVVLFLAYTGVRFGEMAALRVARLDLMRRRAMIAESVTLVRGVQTWGTPKGHERREVPIPKFLIDRLAAHVAGKTPADLVFSGPKGGALRSQGFQRAALTAAATEIGKPGLHPHELRHTAASLAIASGADVKIVQQMLGHKSATMTLDLYGHLYHDRLDEVADRLDAAARASADVYPLCTVGDLIKLPGSR